MATVTQSNLGVNHEKISVVIAKDDYAPKLEKSLKDYAKHANIPGFRKGNVPVGMVKKMYGKGLMADEVLRSASTQVDAYLKEKGIEYLAQPMGLANGEEYDFDINNPKDYNFDFEIGLRPQFEIPLLANRTNMNAYKVAVSDEMVNEEVDKIIYRAGKMEDIEELANEDDVLNVTIEACDATGAVEEGAFKKTNSVLLKYFNPNFKQTLIGKKAGDHFICTLPAAFEENILPALEKDCELTPNAEENKETYFKFNLDKLGHVEKAAVDTALFEQTFPNQEIDTEEKFRAKLKEEIAMYWESQGRTKFHNDIFERLVHETPIELPTAFLKRWAAEGGETPKPMEEVEANWGSFEHSLIWQLISEKLVRENKLIPSKDEIEEGIKFDVMNYLASMGFPADDAGSDLVKSIVDKQMKDEKYMNEQFDKQVTNKLFLWLETQVNINMTELPIEEFVQLKSEHHHHH
jgi:trigger factor